MKKIGSLFLIVAAIGFLGSGTARAQFPIKIPKISKPKTEPTPDESSQPAAKTDSQTSQMAAATGGEDKPTIAKDSIQIRAYTVGEYQGKGDTWSWVPEMQYRVNGPIPSGSQLYADFTLSGAGGSIKFDCKTGETTAGHWWKTDCGGNDLPRAKAITYTGPVNFGIKLRNELAGTDSVLFTGKMKIARVHSNLTGPTAVNKWVYYVDHDWNLPIGYIFLEPDDIKGWNYPELNFAFWTRGPESDPYEPHLFHNGKEVGKMYYEGEEVGKAGCGEMEAQNNTTHDTEPEGQFNWTRWKCHFPNVKAWDKSGGGPGMLGQPYLLSSGPGDYEIKILFKGHLVRSIKFAVDAQGKLVDNGIAASNKLGSDRVVVPVQVIGDSDGQWSRNAWRTDAFYGNPLTGFSAP